MLGRGPALATIVLLGVALVGAGRPPLAGAGTAFPPQRALSPSAATDGSAEDTRVAIESDQGGTWIAAWRSADPAAGVDAGARAVVFSRSTDDGLAWSAPQVVRPEFAGDDPFKVVSGLALATDGAGTWILAAARSFARIDVVVSTDNGASWGPPVAVDDPVFGQDFFPSVAFDGAGHWVVAWETTDTLGGTIGIDQDLLYSRSSDGGASWSPPAVLNTTAATDGPGSHDSGVRLGGGAGTLLAIYDSPGFRVSVARSADGGATWSPPSVLSHSGDADVRDPTLATNGSGLWIAVWRNDQDDGVLDSPDLYFSRSVDDGQTWSAESLLSPQLTAGDFRNGTNMGRVRYVGGRTWSVLLDGNFFPRGGPGVSDSYDDGITWSSPAELLPRFGRKDFLNSLGHAYAVSTGTGTRIVIRESTDDLGGTIGSDPDILVTVARRDCPLLPREDCLGTTRVGGSRLLIKDTVAGSDSLKWTLRYGAETLPADLGDPASGDDYALCLFEKNGPVAGLVGEWDAKGGSTCKALPCWSGTGTSVRYRDAGVATGSIKSLRVQSGPDGKATVKAVVKGPALAPPPMPLDVSAPVRLQLLNLATNACWEGVHDQATTNDASRFVSTSD